MVMSIIIYKKMKKKKNGRGRGFKFEHPMSEKGKPGRREKEVR